MKRREMVLNHASVYAPNAPREQVSIWLCDLAKGIAELRKHDIVGGEWRMQKDPSEVSCQPGYTLRDAFEALRIGRHRDEFLFLTKLSTKTPLDVGMATSSRYRGCEYRGCEGLPLTPEAGDPLLLCAITGSVAVGLPSEAVWDKDQVTVEFRELLPDESWYDAAEEIDNIARSAHADPIFQRHQKHLIAGTDPKSLWAGRKQVFPALSFGPGVESNLEDHASNLTIIVGKLMRLDRAAAAWTDGPTPVWGLKVTDESQSLRQNPRRTNTRRFPSSDGTTRVFTRHARFGSGGRIHLRIDPTTREVEIGYIGQHLP